MNAHFIVTVLSLLAAALLPAWPGAAQTDEEKRRIIDFQDRMRRGEPGRPGDQAFIQQFMGRMKEEYPRAHPPRESTGMIPLTELGKGTYKGEQGGLYPGGENAPPAAHLRAGLELARRIRPLGGDGREASDGRIVMISAGMSNTTMEAQTFLKRLEGENGIHPKFLFVDCAQGGQVAIATSRPEHKYWTVAEERLRAAGITPQQVQVAWLKQANAAPMGDFPDEPKKLQGDLARIVRILREKYPNLKIVYLSSRIYAGYAKTPLNPEPHAYEGGFAVKWLIADQIAGNPELNYDAAKGAVKAPWLAWGPYLWADGTKARGDGLTWVRQDLMESDGTHPSPAGREKVAGLLLDFLKKDGTARPWFVGK